jgi:molybdopterin converting factor subunit 1
MTVRVCLFAVAKELAGRGEVTLELAPGATLTNVRRVLVETVPQLDRVMPYALFAVDAEYANDDTVINEQSEIALIPPVSGG